MKRILVTLIVALVVGLLAGCDVGVAIRTQGTATPVPVHAAAVDTPAPVESPTVQDLSAMPLKPDFGPEDLLDRDAAWRYNYDSFRQTTVITWTQPSGDDTVARIQMDAVKSDTGLLGVFIDNYVRNVSLLFREGERIAGPVTFLYAGGSVYAEVGDVWQQVDTVNELVSDIGWVVQPRTVIEDAPAPTLVETQGAEATRIDDTGYVEDLGAAEDAPLVSEPMQEPTLAPTSESDTQTTLGATALPTVQGEFPPTARPLPTVEGQATSDVMTPTAAATGRPVPTMDISPESTVMPAGSYPPQTFLNEDLVAANAEVVNGMPAWHYRYEDVTLSPTGFFGEFEQGATIDVWVSMSEQDVIRMTVDATAVDPDLGQGPRSVQVLTTITRINEPLSFDVPQEVGNTISFEGFTRGKGAQVDVVGESAGTPAAGNEPRTSTPSAGLLNETPIASDDEDVGGAVVDAPEYDAAQLAALLDPYGVPVFGEPDQIDVLQDVVIYRVNDSVNDVSDFYVGQFEGNAGYRMRGAISETASSTSGAIVTGTPALLGTPTPVNTPAPLGSFVVTGTVVAGETVLPGLAPTDTVGAEMRDIMYSYEDMQGRQVDVVILGSSVTAQTTVFLFFKGNQPLVGASDVEMTGPDATPTPRQTVQREPRLTPTTTATPEPGVSSIEGEGPAAGEVADLEPTYTENELLRADAIWDYDYESYHRSLAITWTEPSGIEVATIAEIDAVKATQPRGPSLFGDDYVRNVGVWVSQGGVIAGPIRFVTAEDAAWTSAQGGWQEVQISDMALAQLGWVANPGALMQGADSVTLVESQGDRPIAINDQEYIRPMGSLGDEDMVGANVEVVNGIPAWHYRLEGVSVAPMASIGQIADDATADMWISVEDGVVVRMILVGQVTSERGTDREVAIKTYLSQVNEPITFAMPDEAAQAMVLPQVPDADMLGVSEVGARELRRLLAPLGIPVLDNATNIEILDNLVIYNVPESPEEVRDMLVAGFEEGDYSIETDETGLQARYSRDGQEVDIVVISRRLSNQTTVIYSLDGFESLAQPSRRP